ncbi:tetratricopeptide repeat protein [Novosphingobium aquimarinum]|uniref:tetratricopeptide repeat protein n=1 Tax=Novosphingobium aquimarinum TaxID=2682494 RepID=UPI0012EC1044|nr:tetratricopeptide repeat protein [Novosphingobium aquimarinum]
MALPPSETPKTKGALSEKAAQRKAAQDEVFLREVDDALRQDQFEGFFKRYGIPVIALIVLGLAAFGGWLWWHSDQKAKREAHAETFIKALDDVEASNLKAADDKLAVLASEANDGSAASAKLMRAGIALQNGDQKAAASLYGEVAGDDSVPQPLRDLATVRSVAATYETMKPQDVIDRLKPYTQPGNPFFGIAGEMTGFAYLKQGKENLAGPLFAKIARDESQPDSLRSRTRQIAGVLGVDAIEDVIEDKSQRDDAAPSAEMVPAPVPEAAAD